MKGLLGKMVAVLALAASRLSTPRVDLPKTHVLELPNFFRRFVAPRRNRSTTKPATYRSESRSARARACQDGEAARQSARLHVCAPRPLSAPDRRARREHARGARAVAQHHIPPGARARGASRVSRNDTFDVMLRRNERLRSEAATYFGMYKMAAAERDELRKQRDAAVKDNKRLRTRYLFEEALPAFLRPQAQ